MLDFWCQNYVRMEIKYSEYNIFEGATHSQHFNQADTVINQNWL
jgi:hypothetical protein